MKGYYFTFFQLVHEKTVIHAVDMLKLWCRKFIWSYVPQSLISCFQVRMVLINYKKRNFLSVVIFLCSNSLFQKKMTTKNSLPLVNAAMIECMAVCFTGECMLQGLDIAELLLKCIDKVTATQV